MKLTKRNNATTTYTTNFNTITKTTLKEIAKIIGYPVEEINIETMTRSIKKVKVANNVFGSIHTRKGQKAWFVCYNK